MSDLKNGKYIIVRAGNSAPPPFPVGANNQGEPVDNVISGGKSHIWAVEKLANGSYILLLEQGGMKWMSYGHNGVVLVGNMPGPMQGWVIRKQQDGIYSIEVPSERWPTTAWTLDNTLVGSKVTLGIFELPREGQLWKFIPIPE